MKSYTLKKKTNCKYHNIQRNKYSLPINYWRQFCFMFYVNTFPDAALCLVTRRVWPCDPMDCSPPGSSVCGDSPGKNTGVGCHALLQGVFPTQGSNPGLPHCRWILLLTEPPGKSFSWYLVLFFDYLFTWQHLILSLEIIV